VEHLAFAPDGESLLVACSDPTIRRWRFRRSGDLPEPLSGHGSAVATLAFSADDRFLASGSADGAIKLWQAETGRELATLNGHRKGVSGLAFLADGRMVSAGLDGRVLLWRLTPNGRDETSVAAVSTTITAGDDPCRAIAAPALTGQNEIAVGGESGIIRIWDLNDSLVKGELKGHERGVGSIAYCGPRAVVSASLDGTVRFWDVPSSTAYSKETFPAGMRTVSFFPDSQSLAASGDSREVCIWTIESMERQLTLSAHPRSVRSVAFAPFGHMIATACDDGRIRLWDSMTGLPLYAMQGHGGPINALAFSNQGSILASCDELGRILLWRTGGP
jgi:WD40 repeat protein